MMSLENWIQQCKEWAAQGRFDLIAKSAKKRRAAKQAAAFTEYNRRLGEHYDREVISK